MLQCDQIALGKTLLDYVEHKKTATSEAIYRQDVDEYINPQIAALEQQTFFHDDALCLGLSARLPTPGSYFTDDLTGVPIVVTRDAQGVVHAYLNVCRHRGSQVASGSGKARSFVCPYHAWSYDLRGRLIARPEEASFDGAPRTDHGLVELSAKEVDGLIWVCPNRERDFDLEQKLAGLAPEIAAYNLGTFHHFDSYIIRRQMNWKLVIDTFLESYHFCVLHKSTICSIFHDNLTAFDAWGANFRIVSPRRTIADLSGRDESDWNVMPHIVGIYVLFPNTVLVWQLDHIELWHVYPGDEDPNSSVLRLDLYTPEPARSEKAKQYWQKNLDLVVKVVQEEDFPVGETIQQGFHSGAQREIVFGTNEPALSYYHRTITEALTQATEPQR